VSQVRTHSAVARNADAQQPIVVRNDMTGVTVAVMQKAEAKAAAAK